MNIGGKSYFPVKLPFMKETSKGNAAFDISDIWKHSHHGSVLSRDGVRRRFFRIQGKYFSLVNTKKYKSTSQKALKFRNHWKLCWNKLLCRQITSRVSGPDNRISHVFPSVCVGVCESYIVHHFSGTGLSCAPPTCVVLSHDRTVWCMMSCDVKYIWATALWNVWCGRCANAGAFEIITLKV